MLPKLKLCIVAVGISTWEIASARINTGIEELLRTKFSFGFGAVVSTRSRQHPGALLRAIIIEYKSTFVVDDSQVGVPT
jgi:hypothetical protein